MVDDERFVGKFIIIIHPTIAGSTKGVHMFTIGRSPVRRKSLIRSRRFDTMVGVRPVCEPAPQFFMQEFGHTPVPVREDRSVIMIERPRSIELTFSDPPRGGRFVNDTKRQREKLQEELDEMSEMCRENPRLLFCAQATIDRLRRNIERLQYMKVHRYVPPCKPLGQVHLELNQDGEEKMRQRKARNVRINSSGSSDKRLSRSWKTCGKKITNTSIPNSEFVDADGNVSDHSKVQRVDLDGNVYTTVINDTDHTVVPSVERCKGKAHKQWAASKKTPRHSWVPMKDQVLIDYETQYREIEAEQKAYEAELRKETEHQAFIDLRWAIKSAPFNLELILYAEEQTRLENLEDRYYDLVSSPTYDIWDRNDELERRYNYGNIDMTCQDKAA